MKFPTSKTLNAVLLTLLVWSVAQAAAPPVPMPKPVETLVQEIGNAPQKLLEVAQAAFCAGDYKTSRELADHCIALMPQNAEAFNIRASARYGLLDFKGAIADYNRAEALGYGDGCDCRLFNRGLSQYALGNYAAAEKDLVQRLAVEHEGLVPYNKLWIVLAILNQGRAPAAEDFRHDTTQWPGAVFDYYQGRGSRGEVLAQAAAKADPDDLRERLSEAFYFLGQWALLNGKKRMARRDFQRVMALDYPRCNEYRLSKAELMKFKPAGPVKRVPAEK